MLYWLKNRKMLDSHKIENEVHLLVVDNAMLYKEKPLEKTHSPNALELAKVLNKIGNKYGVFVHYLIVTPEIIRELFPSGVPFDSHLVHIANARPKTGPGEATNLGFAYMRTHQEFFLNSSDEKRDVLISRVPDDIKLPMKKIKWVNAARPEEKMHRNVFFDIEDIVKGAIIPTPGSRGYDFDGHKYKYSGRGAVYRVFQGKPSEFYYYGTRFGKDKGVKHSKNVREFNMPNYLFHGKRSTWSKSGTKSDVFGWLIPGVTPIEGLNQLIVSKIIAASGIKRPTKT